MWIISNFTLKTKQKKGRKVKKGEASEMETLNNKLFSIYFGKADYNKNKWSISKHTSAIYFFMCFHMSLAERERDVQQMYIRKGGLGDAGAYEWKSRALATLIRSFKLFIYLFAAFKNYSGRLY